MERYSVSHFGAPRNIVLSSPTLLWNHLCRCFDVETHTHTLHTKKVCIKDKNFQTETYRIKYFTHTKISLLNTYIFFRGNGPLCWKMWLFWIVTKWLGYMLKMTICWSCPLYVTTTPTSESSLNDTDPAVLLSVNWINRKLIAWMNLMAPFTPLKHKYLCFALLL